MNKVITKNYDNGNLISIYENNKLIKRNIWSNGNILMSISGKINTVYERDDDGNIKTITEIDTVTNEHRVRDIYERDIRGNVIKHVSKYGLVKQECKIDYNTDSMYSMRTTSSIDDNITTYSEIDDVVYVTMLNLLTNRITTRVYDKRDNLLKIIMDNKIVYEAVYNDLDQIISLKDVCLTCTTETDSCGRVVTSKTHSEEHGTTTTVYDYTSDNDYIKNISDPGGRTEVIEVKNGVEIYHLLQREKGSDLEEKYVILGDDNLPTKEINKVNGEIVSQTVYTYNKNNKLMQEVTTYYNVKEKKKPMFIKR